VVVGVGYSRMPIVVINIDMVRLRVRDSQGIESLAGSEAPEGNHVDGDHEMALPVIRQKWPCRQGRGVDVERAETGEIVG
jgi:hypothetical protein